MISLVGHQNPLLSRQISSNIDSKTGTILLKRGFAHMLKHGVIMDVTDVNQAQIAEEAGAVAVMVLDKLPIEIRQSGGVARTAGMKIIKDVVNNVSIPVMAKCRIGHISEAVVLENSGVDMIDESEVLTPADESSHIWKWDFTTPFVDGAKNLGQALRRIEEGASMMRTKGEPGTGNVVEAVRHMRAMNQDIAKITYFYNQQDKQELFRISKELNTSYELVVETGRLGRLPVVNFAAGGITTPADAALMMKLGCDGVLLNTAIAKAKKPFVMAKAMKHAVIAGRQSYLSGRINKTLYGVASSPDKGII